MDWRTMSFTRSLRRESDQTQVNFYIDIGSQFTTVLIGNNHQINFIKHIPIAGDKLNRQVAEKLESILFLGTSSYTYGGGTIYGYMDEPNRNTITLGTDWDDSSKTGTQILDDVRSMKQASIDAKHYGPWMVYVPTAYETKLDDDYKAESDKTIRQRILEIAGINEVKVVDKLTANNILLIQMTQDVVRMVEGMPLTTVEWDEGGGFATNYKVMTIMVPQIRADQEGNSGVTHMS